MTIKLGTPEFERLNDVLEEVFTERERQHEKWGEQNHPDGTDAIHTETMERARILCAVRVAEGNVTWKHILFEEVAEASAETNQFKLRKELIQVAAVAVAWVEAIDRRQS